MNNFQKENLETSTTKTLLYSQIKNLALASMIALTLGGCKDEKVDMRKFDETTTIIDTIESSLQDKIDKIDEINKEYSNKLNIAKFDYYITKLIQIEEDPYMLQILSEIKAGYNDRHREGHSSSFNYIDGVEKFNIYLMNQSERILYIKKRVADQFACSENDYQKIFNNLHINERGYQYNIQVTEQNVKRYDDFHGNLEGSRDFNNSSLFRLNKNGVAYENNFVINVGDIVKVGGGFGSEILSLPENQSNTIQKKKFINNINKVDDVRTSLEDIDYKKNSSVEE